MGNEDRTSNSKTIDGYDVLAERRDAVEPSPWGDSAYQRHYVWPGVEPLLPSVEGKRVLDAGCGIGEHVGWFLERGAEVVGVDASPEAVAIARDRFGDGHGDGAAFHCADLTEPMSFASDSAYDLTFANLVLDHVERWTPVFEEFERVLDPSGVLVFSTIHPMRRYRRHRDELTSYYETEAYAADWSDTGVEIEHYHRPIGDVVDSLTEAGFALDEFREITPRESYAEHNPQRYERAMREPDTLCVRARPAGSDG